ncbi:MAG: hypothetical protein HYX47_01115 [Burkholderiales bacterium]|nr:hypothetical protein [Burkholderiales bacterium]
MKLNLSAACVLGALAAGCGGGDDGPPAAPPAVTAAPAPAPAPAPPPARTALATDRLNGGVILGHVDLRCLLVLPCVGDITTVTLETGKVWMYSNVSLFGSGTFLPSTFEVVGPRFGQSSAGGQSFYVSQDFKEDRDFESGAVQSVAMMQADGIALNDRRSYRFNSVVANEVNAPAADLSLYNYNTPASLASIAGPWNEGIVVSATGAISGSMANIAYRPLASDFQRQHAYTACAVSGTIAPRASGKNIFDVSLSFSGQGCAIAGQAHQGIALTSMSTATASTLLFMAEPAARNYYSAFRIARAS